MIIPDPILILRVLAAIADMAMKGAGKYPLSTK
jgi:hypothetical protein